jgi:hypothetical protein
MKTVMKSIEPGGGCALYVALMAMTPSQRGVTTRVAVIGGVVVVVVVGGGVVVVGGSVVVVGGSVVVVGGSVVVVGGSVVGVGGSVVVVGGSVVVVGHDDPSCWPETDAMTMLVKLALFKIVALTTYM